jgi:hypothetical protein
MRTKYIFRRQNSIIFSENLIFLLTKLLDFKMFLLSYNFTEMFFLIYLCIYHNFLCYIIYLCLKFLL